MGWTYGWDSKRELVDELLDPARTDYSKPIGHSVVGNHLWVAREASADAPTPGDRWIILYLLNGRGNDGHAAQ
jgi:hypothetical protein